MPFIPNWNARRLIVMRLIIELMRVAYDANYNDDAFGSNSERSIIVLAVAVGQLEQRPMTASKIAQYIGIPRATVLRKLDELVALGRVRRDEQKQFYIVSIDEQPEHWAKAVKAMEKMIREASTALSILDT